ncbi:hypothetical protein FHT40_000262 [Mycolicibacterium sp. BK556]|uniref:hypothetical protein n=1 Tax=Mycobacteriaceae TaxID=1762 RepID=UPI0010612500|nr:MULTISPECIES: hypothetical protein [Mycobacteriaceae]MBB3600629.1 hypothetical protein [Mycolicibacterium sp. BK556]MBB3630382.1 hypothetical protein [Mycolicibacterium sp. BK607]TDO10170.1 hypothetical protein EV580_4456 [Mycobacterium sp. BK086]
MYDVTEVMRTIDEHTAIVVVLVLFGWLGGFAQIGEALRLGFTQRVAGQPLGTTIVMLAHDLTYSLHYQHFVHDIGHPMFVLFWYGMVVSNLIEFIMLFHWIRYQRSGLPTVAVCLLVAAFQSLAFALWWWVQSLLDDPLDLIGLTMVQVGAVAFGVPMLLGRNTARGSSRIFVWATLLGPGSLGFLFIPYLAPEFASSWQFWTVVTTTMMCAVSFVLLYEWLRRRDERQPLNTESFRCPSSV